jgi:hypothetical protein
MIISVEKKRKIRKPVPSPIIIITYSAFNHSQLKQFINPVAQPNNQPTTATNQSLNQIIPKQKSKSNHHKPPNTPTPYQPYLITPCEKKLENRGAKGGGKKGLEEKIGFLPISTEHRWI